MEQSRFNNGDFIRPRSGRRDGYVPEAGAPRAAVPSPSSRRFGATFHDMFAPRHQCRRGFSLIELVIGTATTTVLVAGLFVALHVSATALSPSMASNAIVDTSNVVAGLTAELQLATNFSEREATAVTFSLTDRDGDALAETIRYTWSGTSGDPLTRQYNDGPARTVLSSVADFSLHYDVVTEIADDAAAAAPKYYLRAVRIELQPTAAAGTRLRAAALVVNAPEVALP